MQNWRWLASAIQKALNKLWKTVVLKWTRTITHTQTHTKKNTKKNQISKLLLLWKVSRNIFFNSNSLFFIHFCCGFSQWLLHHRYLDLSFHYNFLYFSHQTFLFVPWSFYRAFHLEMNICERIHWATITVRGNSVGNDIASIWVNMKQNQLSKSCDWMIQRKREFLLTHLTRSGKNFDHAKLVFFHSLSLFFSHFLAVYICQCQKKNGLYSTNSRPFAKLKALFWIFSTSSADRAIREFQWAHKTEIKRENEKERKEKKRNHAEGQVRHGQKDT